MPESNENSRLFQLCSFRGFPSGDGRKPREEDTLTFRKQDSAETDRTFFFRQSAPFLVDGESVTLSLSREWELTSRNPLRLHSYETIT